jgi:hypothetical protein
MDTLEANQAIVITAVPPWLVPVVRTVTIPTLGRDFDSRRLKTSGDE